MISFANIKTFIELHELFFGNKPKQLELNKGAMETLLGSTNGAIVKLPEETTINFEGTILKIKK